MNVFNKIIFSTILLLAGTGAFSQEDITLLPDWKVKSLAKTAELDGEVYLAIDYYEEYLTRIKENEAVLASLAELYWKSKDYLNAAEIYFRLLEINENEGLYLLRYALLQKSLDKPASAFSYLERYERNFLNENPDPEIALLVQREKEGCELAEKSQKNPRIGIHRLPNNINYPHIESNPVPYVDSSLFFSSIRTESFEFEANAAPKGEIYYAQQKDTLYTVKPHNLPINDSVYNVANIAFNEEKNQIIFSKCLQTKPGYFRCDLYRAKYTNEGWSKPEPLRTLNERNYTQTQPCFAKGPDGRELIYFVSDRPGGSGQKDIWYALGDGSGGFAPPKNCGNNLNTIGDEQTPWYNNKEKTLYFSSNGLPGFGGMDIFSVNGYATKWASPKNLGAPVNSGADELYFNARDTLSGYFTSNRQGVNSLRGATCCDDIFRYEFKKTINLTVEGNVGFTLAGDTNKKSITVGLYKDLGGKSVLLEETNPDEKGNYKFRVSPNEKYRIVAKKEGYLKSQTGLSTEGVIEDKKFTTNQLNLLINTKQPIVVKNIYYPFDEAYLTESSKITIDTTIFSILLANPTIQIELGSHTDWFGSDTYNESLSQRRAQSVVDYLIEKGIPYDRLVAKGYGEKRPIAPNQNPDGSDNPEGRARNRRTEFRIIGVLPQYEEIIYEE